MCGQHSWHRREISRGVSDSGPPDTAAWRTTKKDAQLRPSFARFTPNNSDRNARKISIGGSRSLAPSRHPPPRGTPTLSLSFAPSLNRLRPLSARRKYPAIGSLQASPSRFLLRQYCVSLLATAFSDPLCFHRGQSHSIITVSGYLRFLRPGLGTFRCRTWW